MRNPTAAELDFALQLQTACEAAIAEARRGEVAFVQIEQDNSEVRDWVKLTARHRTIDELGPELEGG